MKNELMNYNGEEVKYTSLMLVDEINKERLSDGNTTMLLHKSMLIKIREEFDEEINRQNILLIDFTDSRNRKQPMYELTFDQALQILMTESKQVRRGVINVLKIQQREIDRLKLPDFTNPIIAARAWANECESKMLAEARIKELEVPAAIAKALTDSRSEYSMAETAKILEASVNGKLIGRNNLLKFLREGKIIMENNEPYQRYINLGYFIYKTSYIDAAEMTVNTPFVTGKGLAWLQHNISKIVTK